MQAKKINYFCDLMLMQHYLKHSALLVNIDFTLIGRHIFINRYIFQNIPRSTFTMAP